MNLLKSKLRRTTAVVAGALLGLTGVAFFAAPASAHASAVSGAATCDTTTGEWVVTWTVNTNNGHTPHSKMFRFVRVEQTPAASPVDGIAHTPDDADPVFPYRSNKPLTGTQRVAGDAKEASLTVQVKWSDDFTEWDPKTGTVDLHGTCNQDAPKPEAQIASSCEGVTVTLTNSESTKKTKRDAEFTVTGSEGFQQQADVTPGSEPVVVKIPAKNAAKVVVTEKHQSKPLLEGEWKQPTNCKSAGKVEEGYTVTCDSLVFTIDNTKGDETVTATFTPNKGKPKTLVVKVGETKSAIFKGQPGLEVTPSEGGVAYEPVKWDSEKKPADCTPSPSPSASGGGGGGPLPVTGANAGGIAGGAAGLLAIGSALFFMARRRRVKFTA